MAFVIDKLSICNDALLATGNQTVTGIDDGSPEWIAVSNFYDRSLVKVLSKHDWKFALNMALMTRVGSSAYPGYADMYELPPDCLQLRVAYDARDAALIQPFDVRIISETGINLPPMDYRIIGNNVHCICPQGAWAFYVVNPATDPTNATVGFAETLRLEIEGLLSRGFNEDVEAAAAIKALTKEELTEAREEDSAQENRRIMFRSPMLERRRRRRNFWGAYW